MNKMNPITGILYTDQEAIYEQNSRRPIRKEYWLKRGYSEDDAITKANNTKIENNIYGSHKSSSRSVEQFRSSSKRCVEYWTIRGHSMDDAIKLVAKEQSTFSLEKCIANHGQVDGTRKWTERQEKWQNTLNNKSDEEKQRINRLKTSAPYSVSKAEHEIYKILVNDGIFIDSQYCISTDIGYVYDMRMGNNLVEYNGDYWHCNPKLYNADFLNKSTGLSAAESWEKDNKKNEYAKSVGYNVLVVWERDYKLDPQKVIDECIRFLTQ